MFPLLSRGRVALGGLLVVTLLLTVLEPRLWPLLLAPDWGGRPFLERVAAARALEVGPPAAPLVLELLVRGRDPAARASACGAVGRWRLRSLAGSVAVLASSPEPGLRREARGALEILVGADALRRLDAVPPLLASLRTRRGDEAQTEAALRGLARVGAGYPASAVVSFLVVGSPDVRMAAEEALVALGDEAVAVVLPLLDDPRYAVFLAAARTLGRLRPAATARLLAARVFEGTPDANRRLRLYVALELVGAPEGIEALRRGARYESEPGLRLAAVKAMAAVRDPSVVPALLEAARDEHEAVRGAALAGLRSQGSPEAHRGLVDLYLGGSLGTAGTREAEALFRAPESDGGRP